VIVLISLPCSPSGVEVADANKARKRWNPSCGLSTPERWIASVPMSMPETGQINRCIIMVHCCNTESGIASPGKVALSDTTLSLCATCHAPRRSMLSTLAGTLQPRSARSDFSMHVK